MAFTSKPIALGSDESNSLTAAITDALSKEHRLRCFGALVTGSTASEKLWVPAAASVAKAIQSGECEYGVLFCYTGTGVAMAANKFKGIRAALCADKETAIGARRWNNANVLVMSLRLTTPTLGLEILDGFFSAHPDSDEETRYCLTELEKLDSKLK
ncbi:MAG: RpiB/LacA/LacB family sugar-phosphate isomerase [Chloroherpetonaceae bacterium]|nr:RpiB/LacA/LacB family sugar-phosphate isomerase [Chloroherpetonaceae bacterium]